MSVGNDLSCDIGGDNQCSVGGDESRSIEGDQELGVTGDQTITVDGNHELTAANSKVTAKEIDVIGTVEINLDAPNIEMTAKGDVITLSGSGIAITSKTVIYLTVGASQIEINPAEIIVTSPMIKLNP